MTDLLIINGTLITDSSTSTGDILIHDGKIADVGQNLIATQAEIMDVSGKFILPGGVDPHTHFDLPMAGTVSSDDHYTGTKAAAFGGTTTVIDFVSLDFPTLKESVEAWHRKAEKAAIDYSFHMNLTRMDDGLAAEIPSLPRMGITTLKTFTAYNHRLRLQDGEIFRAMRIARDQGMLVMLHAENGDVIETLITEALQAGHTSPEWHARTRPAWGAVEATLRACALAAQAEASLYIVHMNVAGEVDMLKYARQRGVKVMGETCPQYLFFTEEHLRQKDGAKWVCSPPVRTKADNDRLWEGVRDSTLQTIGTDHCPFFFDGTKPIIYEGQLVAIPGKELGKNDFTKIPNGLPGVGDRLPILWTTGVGSGKISPQQFVALTATNPAKIFGLYPRKGALLPGSDADLIIWDTLKKVKHGVAYSAQRTDYNLYEGWELTGYPEKVFLRGECIVDGGKWLGRRGAGRFLPRQPFAPIL
jgi:dihydropyrimidinase